MGERPAASREAVGDPGAENGGYPLREEATEPLSSPPPAEAEASATEELEPAPAATGPPTRHRRRTPAGPWPWIAAVALLLAGLGVAYGVTRDGRANRAGSPPAAAASPRPHRSGAATRAHSAATAAAAPAPTGSARPAPPKASTPPPAKFAVPSVLSNALPRAVAILRHAGLTPTVTHVSSDQPTGKVLAQHPSAGATLPRGGQVRLDVAVQPLVAVPDVTGMQGLDAVHLLHRDHLATSLRYVPSTQTARRVVSQWPHAGRKVRRGHGVLLNLSQGLRPRTSKVTVPDVTGEDEASATSDLRSAGFDVGSVTVSVSDPSEDGLVVDESPNGGAEAAKGSTVTISLGQYGG
jgi:hypothetical protein